MNNALAKAAMGYEALVHGLMDDFGLGEQEARAAIARVIHWLEDDNESDGTT